MHPLIGGSGCLPRTLCEILGCRKGDAVQKNESIQVNLHAYADLLGEDGAGKEIHVLEEEFSSSVALLLHAKIS